MLIPPQTSSFFLTHKQAKDAVAPEAATCPQLPEDGFLFPGGLRDRYVPVMEERRPRAGTREAAP